MCTSISVLRLYSFGLTCSLRIGTQVPKHVGDSNLPEILFNEVHLLFDVLRIML